MTKTVPVTHKKTLHS